MAQVRSDTTKAALVQAAFHLFSEKGYAGTSTRELATAANTNIASINYHFGSKAGLRMACAETIVKLLIKMRDNPQDLNLPSIIDTAETKLEMYVLRQAYVLLSLDEADAMIGFLFREAHEKGEVFEHIYKQFFGPVFSFFHMLFLDATDQTNSMENEEASKLVVFSIIAQFAYFQIGKPAVIRHLDWEGYGEDRILKILKMLQINIRAVIAAHRSVS